MHNFVILFQNMNKSFYACLYIKNIIFIVLYVYFGSLFFFDFTAMSIKQETQVYIRLFENIILCEYTLIAIYRRGFIMFNFVHRDLDFAHKLDYASSPKDEYSKHLHSFYELILFIRGDVDYSIEGEMRHLEPGMMILIRPGTFHFATVNHDVSYERYVYKFPTYFVPDGIHSKLGSSYPFYAPNRHIAERIKSLDEDFQHFGKEDMYALCKAKIIETLVYLTNSKQVNKEVKEEDVTMILIDYIENHIKEDLSLANIAADLHYSESYLSNRFKQTMKCSLMKYIRSKKIILAHAMIQEGKKASDVCEELGFNDYSTFYRAYVKETGMSPTKNKA